jgi:hypothetical protein
MKRIFVLTAMLSVGLCTSITHAVETPTPSKRPLPLSPGKGPPPLAPVNQNKPLGKGAPPLPPASAKKPPPPAPTSKSPLGKGAPPEPSMVDQMHREMMEYQKAHPETAGSTAKIAKPSTPESIDKLDKEMSKKYPSKPPPKPLPKAPIAKP